MSKQHGQSPFAGRRQEDAIRLLADHVDRSPHLGAAVLVGSFAQGTADDVSDVDLFLIAREGHFSEAWSSRYDLHVTGALIAWDENEEELVGGHRWLTPDLILFECVVSAPAGGGRLAEPYVLLTGDPDLIAAFPRRPRVDHGETSSASPHPVDLAYDKLKRAVRNSASGFERRDTNAPPSG